MLVLTLSNRGNPDYQQDPRRPLPGTPKDQLVPCGSLSLARQLCLHYIRTHELGGGNWTGGDVYRLSPCRKTRTLVARISYNGRIWAPDGTEIDPDGSSEPATAIRSHG